jgi:TM2 domain-containing membrane protein YozV
MYSVIGPDGKVYGPADSTMLKAWCQEGRITADTNIVDPIDGQVKRASAIPEIAQYLPVSRPPMPQTPPSQPSDYGTAYPPAPMANYNFSQPPVPYGYQHPMAYGPPKSKVVGILLALFLGGLGIHRFYLGHNGTGLAMLLITVLTCGYGAVITVIWALVDIVLIATGALNDGSNRPLV